MNKTGPRMLTFTGKLVNPLDLHQDDICIEDIAHALAYQCRYNGHTKKFYSVAEHCILLAVTDEYPGPPGMKLMHDAAEAYLPDVCCPLKNYLEGFKEIEENVMKVVSKVFGLPLFKGVINDAVKEGDSKIIYWESKALMPEHEVWGEPTKPFVELLGLTPWQAEELFLKLFSEIFEKETS